MKKKILVRKGQEELIVNLIKAYRVYSTASSEISDSADPIFQHSIPSYSEVYNITARHLRALDISEKLNSCDDQVRAVIEAAKAKGTLIEMEVAF